LALLENAGGTQRLFRTRLYSRSAGAGATLVYALGPTIDLAFGAGGSLRYLNDDAHATPILALGAAADSTTPTVSLHVSHQVDVIGLFGLSLELQSAGVA